MKKEQEHCKIDFKACLTALFTVNSPHLLYNKI